MADKVEVAIATTSFTIAPGETTETTVTLHNLGQTVDQFTISIEGIDASWYTLPVSSVALFPNDRDELKVILNPPKVTSTKAGSYPFRINVASQENPDEIVATDLTIEIRPLAEMELHISPQRIEGRRGLYQVSVKNPDDTDITLYLDASDVEEILQYTLEPGILRVPGNGWAGSSLEVRLGWRAFFGGEKEFEFQVTGTRPDVEEAKIVRGQLVRIPWYRFFQRVRVSRIQPAISRVQPAVSRVRPAVYRTRSTVSRIIHYLAHMKIPWLTRPPVIETFKSTTDDRREFKLSWFVKRAKEVTLDGEKVAKQGERLVSPTEPKTYVLAVSSRYGSASKAVDVQPMPLPTEKASERIRVSLSPARLEVQAGTASVPTMLQVQNLGEIVDKLSVDVEGLDETWYSRSASSIALMPQASDQVQITFQLPKTKGVKAREYPFAVTVRSQSNPEEAASVIGHLAVLPLIEFKLAVRPYRVTCRRKGTFRINIANTGVSDASFYLDATDLDEGLKFRFKNDAPEVNAWNSIEVPMITRPKRGSKVGEKKRYDITVTANTGEGISQQVNCELHHNPFIGSWKPIFRVVRALIVLGLIFLVVVWILHLGGGIPGTKVGHPGSWEIWLKNLTRNFTSGNILRNMFRLGWPF